MLNASKQARLFATPSLLQFVGVMVDWFLGDVSGSMNDPGFSGSTAKRLLVAMATHQFLFAKLESRPQDYVSLVAFNHEALVICPPLNVGRDFDSLLQAVEVMAQLSDGGTCMAAGLKAISGMLFGSDWVRLSDGRPTRVLQRVVAYSDGHDQSVETGISFSTSLKKSGVLIETMGVEKAPHLVNVDFLKQVCTKDETGLHYRFLGDVAALHSTFQKLATGTLTVD